MRATSDNWLDAPYNRWGFLHVRELARTARIRRGDGPVRELVTHAGEEAGVVLSGAMDVTVGDTTHRLGPGDAMWFTSDQPHTFTVVGDETCVSLWADTLPDHAPESNEVVSIFSAEHGTAGAR